MPVDHTIKVKARCAYESEKGRCKRTTEVTHPYCPQHTREVLGVYVAPSRIPKAGKGLFAARAFKKGETICIYDGELLTTAQYDKRYDKEGYGSYGMTLNRNWVIDARKTSSGVARYICDFNGSGKKPNVEYQEYKRKIEVVVVKKIEPGDELYADYGDEIRIAMGLQKEK